MPSITIIAALGACFALIMGIVFFIATRLTKLDEQVATERITEADHELPALLREDSLSSISIQDELLQRLQLTTQLKRMLEEADLDWSVGRLAAFMQVAGAAVFAVLWKLELFPTLACVGVGIAATSIPLLLVRRRKTVRFRKLEEAFPDALESLSRALRAGHAFAAGMELLAHESPMPLKGELRRTIDEWKLGRSWEEALEHFAERVPLTSVSVFCAAVRQQSRTGGKLHEVLLRLSDSLREAQALEGEVRAVSAHGRMTAITLTILPLGIAAMMSVASPQYIGILWQHELGSTLVWTAVGLLALGHVVMEKILEIRL
jgi:tight adherence protein B